MEEAVVLYEANGLCIMDTSVGLTVEFSDDDVSHGFTIAHEKLSDPSSWADASKALTEWMG